MTRTRLGPEAGQGEGLYLDLCVVEGSLYPLRPTLALLRYDTSVATMNSSNNNNNNNNKNNNNNSTNVGSVSLSPCVAPACVLRATSALAAACEAMSAGQDPEVSDDVILFILMIMKDDRSPIPYSPPFLLVRWVGLRHMVAPASTHPSRNFTKKSIPKVFCTSSCSVRRRW